MILLDISQSDYIFKQSRQLGIFGVLLCMALIIYGAFSFRKAVKYQHERTRKLECFRAFALTLLSLALWFFGFMPATKKLNKIRQNGVETIGETIKWIKGGKGKRYVQYSFIVNGQKFIAECGIVYEGKELGGIACPGGQYFVIYDKQDPSNSIMDFKRQYDSHSR